MLLQDALGNPLAVGDTVAIATKDNRSVYLRIMKVIEARGRQVRLHRPTKPGRAGIYLWRVGETTVKVQADAALS